MGHAAATRPRPGAERALPSVPSDLPSGLDSHRLWNQCAGLGTGTLHVPTRSLGGGSFGNAGAPSFLAPPVTTSALGQPWPPPRSRHSRVTVPPRLGCVKCEDCKVYISGFFCTIKHSEVSRESLGSYLCWTQGATTKGQPWGSSQAWRLFLSLASELGHLGPRQGGPG